MWSLLSLVFAPPPFDPLAAVSYSSVVALELGIFFLAAILNPRYYKKKRLEEAEEKEKASTQEGSDGEAPRTAPEAPQAAPIEQAERESGFGWMAREGEDIEAVISRRSQNRSEA